MDQQQAAAPRPRPEPEAAHPAKRSKHHDDDHMELIPSDAGHRIPRSTLDKTLDAVLEEAADGMRAVVLLMFRDRGPPLLLAYGAVSY